MKGVEPVKATELEKQRDESSEGFISPREAPNMQPQSSKSPDVH